MSFWRKIAASLGSAETPIWEGAANARAYAIGDVHGRLDLLNDLLGQIEADLARRPVERAFAIFLGDLIDRGPDSRGVVERLMGWAPARLKPVYLMGNHEEVLLRVVAGEPDVLPGWMRFGGAECVASYGIDPALIARVEEAKAVALVRERVPPAHIAFIKSFGDTFRFGDYLFVHAGIRPGVAIERQAQHDLRWIRKGFLDDDKPHGMVVVHGHTIVDSVDERSNRIAIDTGAVYSGVLTALVVEGSERRYLSTGEEPGDRPDAELGAAKLGDNPALLQVRLSP